MAAESSTASSTTRSGGGGGEATADSYIGSLISLTSRSEIRYEGILYNINTEESSIGLRNVRSFGTEGRKKDGPQVPPSEKIYEYILFRGSDIKDLQVKASPPVQNTPPINSDPAIIQSHYPGPTPTPPANLPLAPTNSVPDIGSHASQMGLPGQALQSSLPLYQPGANLNSWGPSPPNANGSGLAIPMYWQGFYGAPNGLSQVPQQSLLRPPPGLPSSMQQMQFSSLNSSVPTTSSSLPGSNLPDYRSSLVPNSTGLSSLTSSSLPASNLPLNVPPPQPMSLTSEAANSLLPNKPPISAAPLSSPKPNLPLVLPLLSYSSVADNVAVPSVSSKPSVVSGSAVLPQQGLSQPPVKPVPLASSIVNTETQTPSLVTPGQLLQFGSSAASQPLQTTHKDVEVVQVLPKQSSEPSASVAKEAQPPILPLLQNARSYNKPNGGAYNMRNHYRGRGGRGPGFTRPVTKFTEDFDFEAMNEKFNKDEVWGHLGKGKKHQFEDKDGNESGSDEGDLQYEDDVDAPKTESKGLYNKDDFFDSLSCNALENNPNHGRTRYSEQMKLDTETFGDFTRYRGGRGGRGPGPARGGGRYRGGSSYYGRGYGGYNYGNRGRGRGVQGHAS